MYASFSKIKQLTRLNCISHYFSLGGKGKGLNAKIIAPCLNKYKIRDFICD